MATDRWSSLLLCLSLTACSGEESSLDASVWFIDAGTRSDATAQVFDDASGPADAGEPMGYRVEGNATGIGPNRERVTCSFRADITDLVFSHDGGWTEFTGQTAAEFVRSILPAGSMQPLDYTIRATAPASFVQNGYEVRLRFVGILGDSPEPFWREIAALNGYAELNWIAGGNWTCAPLLIDSASYSDRTVSIQGEWKMRPLY